VIESDAAARTEAHGAREMEAVAMETGARVAPDAERQLREEVSKERSTPVGSRMDRRMRMRDARQLQWLD
jgi:hypothetical protein